MPSLIRFIVFCAVVGGIVYGAMFALVLYVEPNPREISVRVPTDRINPPARSATTPFDPTAPFATGQTETGPSPSGPTPN
jgi:hypothetical protein